MKRKLNDEWQTTTWFIGSLWTKGKCWGKGQTITSAVSSITTSGRENRKTSRRRLRPAGGLTYCISAGWKTTSNLALLLPGSAVRRSGNNSFSDCWSRQCPWYWKPSGLTVSNPRRQTVQGHLHPLGYHCSMVCCWWSGCVRICPFTLSGFDVRISVGRQIVQPSQIMQLFDMAHLDFVTKANSGGPHHEKYGAPVTIFVTLYQYWVKITPIKNCCPSSLARWWKSSSDFDSYWHCSTALFRFFVGYTYTTLQRCSVGLRSCAWMPFE